MSDTGHYSWLSGRTARFLAHQKRRGMSAAALERLPKVPKLPEPIVLQPVLATKRHAVNPIVQATQLAIQERKRRMKGKQKRRVKLTTRVPKAVPWAKDPDRAERLQRAKEIVALMAEISGIAVRDMDARNRNQRFSLPRDVAAFLMMNLVSVPSGVIAEIFDYDDGATARRMVFRVRARIRDKDPITTDLHDRAMAAVKARWPEYAQS